MGNFNLNSGQIQEYKVQVVTENHPNGKLDVIHLLINSEYYSVKYRICTDERHPDLKVIEQNLLQGLNSGDFGINEYLERSYIFVNYPSGSTAQYTANKI
ncbi:hypothetical protein [Pseudoalteromonas piscicida]|uniref:hypothetical protein n=1 Tax=Pseudoalteromonas piscicida TaxID=43662 RepID=UPI0032C16870